MAEKPDKTFVAFSVYLEPDLANRVIGFAKFINNSKSAACGLLIKKALNMVSDIEIEDIIRQAKEGSH